MHLQMGDTGQVPRRGTKLVGGDAASLLCLLPCGLVGLEDRASLLAGVSLKNSINRKFSLHPSFPHFSGHVKNPLTRNFLESGNPACRQLECRHMSCNLAELNCASFLRGFGEETAMAEDSAVVEQRKAEWEAGLSKFLEVSVLDGWTESHEKLGVRVYRKDTEAGTIIKVCHFFPKNN